MEITHFVNQDPLFPPVPPSLARIVFALGCFWGAERRFWQQNGVYSTAVGYIDGVTQNPSYKDVCTGLTQHAEAVHIVFDPEIITLTQLLKVFFESHDPTQGMRQGNDVGTQYRSGIYTFNEAQQTLAVAAKNYYQEELSKKHSLSITTQIKPAPEFYFAEAYHQQYLAKNPEGYCGLRGTGVIFDSDTFEKSIKMCATLAH